MEKDWKVSLLLDCYGSLLTPRQRSVAELYYNDDLSLMEIAELRGITRQGVLDGIRRARTQLYQWENDLGLLALRTRVQQALEKAAEWSQFDPNVARICEILEERRS